MSEELEKKSILNRKKNLVIKTVQCVKCFDIFLTSGVVELCNSCFQGEERMSEPLKNKRSFEIPFHYKDGEYSKKISEPKEYKKAILVEDVLSAVEWRNSLEMTAFDCDEVFPHCQKCKETVDVIFDAGEYGHLCDRCVTNEAFSDVIKKECEE